MAKKPDKLHLDDNALLSILRSRGDDELRDYQARGSCFANLSDDELMVRYLHGLKPKTPPHPDVRDLSAEIHRRDLKPPAWFMEELTKMVDAAQKDPEHMEDLIERVTDMLVEYMMRDLN